MVFALMERQQPQEDNIMPMPGNLIITGEGHLDAQSFAGKVVGGVAELGQEYGIPVAAIVGVADRSMERRIPTWTLVDAFGEERALREPLWCVERVAADVLAAFEPAAT